MQGKRRTEKTRHHSSVQIFEPVVHKEEAGVITYSQPVDGTHISHRANTAQYQLGAIKDMTEEESEERHGHGGGGGGRCNGQDFVVDWSL